MGTSWQHYPDTGFEPIDAEHRSISEGLERLLGAVNAGDRAAALRTFEALDGQFKAHFAHEERLMAGSGYPLLGRHREAHQLFLGDAGKFLGELKAKGLTVAVRRWVTGRALVWFRFHITANDVGLGLFLLAREKGGEGADATAPATRTGHGAS